jgi:hypothetical protein
MLIHLLDQVSIAPIADLPHHLLGLTHLDHMQMPDIVMALGEKTLEDPDFSKSIGGAWGKFVKTGQVWAFLGGTIFGYLIKTFTTYG